MTQAKTNKGIFGLMLLLITLVLIEACKHDPEITPPPDPPAPENCDTTNVTYTGTVEPILSNNCYGCHGDLTANGGINLQNYETVAMLAQSGKLAGVINHAPGYQAMPPFNKLDSCDIVKIEKWINDTTFDPPGGGNDHPCDPDTVYFENQILPLIKSSCATTDCHDKLTEDQEILLVDYASIMHYGEIEPGNPEESELYEKITEDDEDDRMPPPPAPRFTSEQVNLVNTWIRQGAKNNRCDEDCDTTNVTYTQHVWPIIQNNCFGCHSGNNPGGGVYLRNYDDLVLVANNGKLWGAVNHESGYSPMPKNSPKLDVCDLAPIRIWIEDGTPNN